MEEKLTKFEEAVELVKEVDRSYWTGSALLKAMTVIELRRIAAALEALNAKRE